MFLADMRAGDADEADPILQAMVESGAARDIGDAAMIRNFQLRLAATQDPSERRKMQEQHLLARRKRLAGT